MDITTPWGAVIQGAIQIIDKVIPDPTSKAQAQLAVMQLEQAGQFKQIEADLALQQGQIDTNKIEAQSPSLFKSGWRPGAGWVCVLALGTQFLIAPLGTWLAALYGHPVAFPALDMGTLLTLLGALLGIGGMRTTEKLKGAA